MREWACRLFIVISAQCGMNDQVYVLVVFINQRLFNNNIVSNLTDSNGRAV